MINPAPPQATPAGPSPAAEQPSSAPQQPEYPLAHIVPPPTRPDRPVTESDTLIEHDGVVDLDGHAVITYQDRRAEADHIAYDTHSGDLTLTGHVLVSGGRNDETIHATHGTYNLRTATGRFFAVSGSVGLRPRSDAVNAISTATTAGAYTPNVPRRAIYTNANPFLFTGRMVVKTGSQTYDVYDGTVTSCQLPRPDWLLSGEHFQIADGEARATNSIFHLLGVPLLYLPYVTHPTDPNERQTGFLIPTAGDSSTRGVYVGEQLYLTLGRSADLTAGAAYYSLRGWSENGSFRYRGANLDFASARYSGLMDKLTGAANQGGEDVVFSGRRDLDEQTRLATNLEYLSSYVYREAFTDSFNQAVTSDIVSDAYATHNAGGREYAIHFDRYQGIKNFAQGDSVQQQVRIFHVPTLEADGVDHALGTSGLRFSYDATASGLKRTQPSLTTSGIAERFDVRPELSYPLQFGLWHADPALAVRETLYTRSRVRASISQAPVESTAGLARSAVDLTLPLRAPVIAADFATPRRLERFFGPTLRHTIAPEVTYHFVDGVNNFDNVLRFDAVDVYANTNEVEYGVTQRLFRTPRSAGDCTTPAPRETVNPALADGPEDALVGGLESAAAEETGTDTANAFGPRPRASDCGQEELLSWRLTQKSFLNQSFGGAIADGRRNVFTTTLDLSGVAFLTEPRAVSPLISRLRARLSSRTDFEWDFDLDIGASKFTSSNVYLNVHEGDFFTGVSYARLDAPGRFYTEGVTPTNATGGVTTAISDFNQLRYLIGYGNASRRGLSVAANLGLDLKAFYGVTQVVTGNGIATPQTVYPPLLQYTSIQGAYNWNCCGIAVEYRKFELGTVENVPGYRFSFTLANIGAAGNLRRQERLF